MDEIRIKELERKYEVMNEEIKMIVDIQGKIIDSLKVCRTATENLLNANRHNTDAIKILSEKLNGDDGNDKTTSKS